jgi:methionine-rich copper-binding protein CopC
MTPWRGSGSATSRGADSARTGRHGLRHRIGLVAAALAVAGGSVLGLAAPASAHNYMIASTPSVDGTLTSMPARFEITTNDRLLDIGNTNSGFAYRIVGPHGRYYEDGCLDVDGPSMTTKAALGASGRYTIEWQIISADGHTVSDRYSFRWDAPASFTPAKGSRTPPSCRTAPAGSSGAAATASTGSAGSGSSGVLGDALWIGGGGLVVVALAVVVFLLLRRPADGRTDGDEDADAPTGGRGARRGRGRDDDEDPDD